MANTNVQPLISVVIPVGERHADVAALYMEYRQGLDRLGKPYETIFVIDGPHHGVIEGLRRLQSQGERLTIITMTRFFGQATSLMVGFERAAGSIIVTLPAYDQIEASEIEKLVTGLDAADMTVGHRWPRAGGWFDRLRRRAFHALVGKITSSRFRDLGCGARAMRREVIEEISLYGGQDRFVPLLADRQGFRVVEIDVRQSPKDRLERGYGAREYARRILDILTVFFLVRFTKKPLRFFGMVGASTFLLGALVITYLVVERLFFGQALADRPALLLASLLSVLGLQLLAIGLLGELIIFTHAREIRDYQVAEVIELGREDRTGHNDNAQAVSG